ncbi:myosin light chain 5 [Prionailurus iriomotensis]
MEPPQGVVTRVSGRTPSDHSPVPRTPPRARLPKDTCAVSIKRLLMSQADKMTAEEVDQMFQFATIDAAGNLDYKALSYVLTHGEEKEE